MSDAQSTLRCRRKKDAIVTSAAAVLARFRRFEEEAGKKR